MNLVTKNGDFIIAGTVTRDSELTSVGEKHTHKLTFSVAVGKNPDTTTIFANCTAWGKLADALNGIKKGESFSGMGQIREHEYNGRVYKDYNLDWGNNAAAPGTVFGCINSPTPAESKPNPFTPPAFVDVDPDDGELPF